MIIPRTQSVRGIIGNFTGYGKANASRAGDHDRLWLVYHFQAVFATGIRNSMLTFFHPPYIIVPGTVEPCDHSVFYF